MKRLLIIFLAAACTFAWGCAASTAVEAPQQEAAVATPGDTAGIAEQKKEGTSIQAPLLFEEAGMKVTATDLRISEEGIFLNLTVRNGGETDVALSTSYTVVDGFMVSGWFYAEVPPGMEAESSLEISGAELSRAGIHTIHSLELYFCAFDPYTFETLAEYEPVTLVIPGTKEEAAAPAKGQALLSQSGITISACDGGDDRLWILIENGSDRNITVESEDVRVDGQTVSAWLCTVVLSGKKTIAQVEMLGEDEDITLQEAGLVDMTLKVMDFEPYIEMFCAEVAIPVNSGAVQ